MFCSQGGYRGKFFEIFNLFELFHTKVVQIDSEWPISPNSQLFPSFATKASHFWRNLKKEFPEGDALANFLSFSTCLNHFTPKWPKMTHNGQFCQKKWLRLAPNGQFWSFCRFFYLFSQNEAQIDSEWPISPHSQLLPSSVTKAHFAGFSIFPPKMRLRFTWNGQFHLIHNFSHLLPPKHLIFGEIPKIFNPRGQYISKFFEFFNFFKLFHTKVAQNDTQWPILSKKWFRNFASFHNYVSCWRA